MGAVYYGDWECQAAKNLPMFDVGATKLFKTKLTEYMLTDVMTPLDPNLTQHETNYLDSDFPKFQRHRIFWLLRVVVWNDEGSVRSIL